MEGILATALIVALAVWLLPQIVEYYRQQTIVRIAHSLLTVVSTILNLAIVYFIRYFYVSLAPDGESWFIAMTEGFFTVLLLLGAIVLSIMLSTYYQLHVIPRFVVATTIQGAALFVIRLGVQLVTGSPILDAWIIVAFALFVVGLIVWKSNKQPWAECF